MELGESHARGARTLFALPDFILDRLAFLKAIEHSAFDFGAVEEQFVRIALDESKTAIRNQLFDRTLWHFCTPEKN